MEKLSRSPLIYVLAQVRIGAVLKMADYVPRIQERLRRTYPLYRMTEIMEFQLGSGKVEPRSTPRWHFDTPDRHTGFLLQESAIVFHTTAYDTSQVFFTGLREGLAVIQEIAEIQVAERLGVRYVDAFQADPGHRLPEYLRDGIRGVSLDGIGASAQRMLVNLVSDTVGGRLVIRLGLNTGSGCLPPDLQPLELEMVRAFPADAELAVLDYDHFIERVVPFSVDDIATSLDRLHEVTSGAFRATVSEFALETWR